jgi:hypothetical protein
MNVKTETRKKIYKIYLDGVDDTTEFIEWIMRLFEIDELDKEDDGRYWFASNDVLNRWKEEHQKTPN